MSGPSVVFPTKGPVPAWVSVLVLGPTSRLVLVEAGRTLGLLVDASPRLGLLVQGGLRCPLVRGGQKSR